MSEALRAGYKLTEVGVIPEAWEAEPIGRCLKIRHGKSQHEVVSASGEYPIFGTGGEMGKASRPLYSKPSVLIGRKGTIDAPRYLDTPFWTVDTLFYSEVFENVDAKFMFYQFCLIDWYAYNEASGVPSLNAKTIEKIQIPYPPSKLEQRAIATALSDIDTLLAKLDTLITKKRNIKQATMQQLLTGQTRLPGFSGEWEVKRLGDVVEIRKGQLITQKDAIPGDIPVIAGGKKPAYFHNQPNRVGKTITVSASGASAGYVAFFDTSIFASDCSTIGESKAYSIEFIYFQLLLKQGVIYKAQTGGAQPHIHAVDLIPLEIDTCSLAEQTAVAAALSYMDIELTTLETRRDKTLALKQGMMQELLTGRIRLV